MNKSVLTHCAFNQWRTITKCCAIAITSSLFVACSNTPLVMMASSVPQVHDLQDYDSDGVVKAREKCDGTVLGAEVDNYGCGTRSPKVEPFVLDIKFAHDSYEIPASAYQEIQRLARFLDEHEQLSIVIEGHTSKVGSKEYNQVLSNNRAKAVAQALVGNFSINEDRVAAIGYGFDRLLDDRDNEYAHESNRRIVAELSHTEYIDKLRWTIYTVDELQ